MSATSSSPSSVAIGDRGEGRGRGAGQLAQRGAEAQLDSEIVELAAQLVAQLLVVGTREDVRRDVGDRHLLVGEEGLDLPGELQPGRTGADDQRAVGGEQRLMGRAEAGSGGGDVGLLGLGRERIRGAGGEHEVVGLEHVTGARA